MELLQLRYFITVSRTLNISKAAQYHMIPQPAMSQTISRLEKELGKPLFDRYRNKLTLTKDGEAFLKSITASIAMVLSEEYCAGYAFRALRSCLSHSGYSPVLPAASCLPCACHIPNRYASGKTEE